MMPFPAKLFRLRSSRNNRRGFEPRTARSDARQAFSRGHTKSGTAGRTPVNDKHAKQEKSLFPAYIIAEKSADVKRKPSEKEKYSGFMRLFKTGQANSNGKTHKIDAGARCARGPMKGGALSNEKRRQTCFI